MVMVPKGDRANVTDIATARARGGRPSGAGYDPATGEQHRTGDQDETAIFGVVGPPGYDERRFYTKSTNAHNHGAELRVRVPQGIDSQVYAAVADVPEYRNRQDFIRDAIVHRLEYIQKRYNVSEEGRRMLELERMRADSERRANDIALMQETIADLGQKLENAWAAEDYGMLAAELVEASEYLLDYLREPYTSQAKKMLTEWNNRAREKIAEHRARYEE